MLVEYDAASKMLSAALSSKNIHVVLKSRDELELLKLQAKRVLDRQLLADATEFQMRVERWLGVLLGDAKSAGHIAEGRRPKSAESRVVTLREIGIDRKLSSRAQKAAALKEDAFTGIISDARAKIVSGGACLLNPVSARRASSEHPASSFDFQLVDGTRLGNVRLGKLKSRIAALSSELHLLRAIYEHIGAACPDALATVGTTMREHALQTMISSAVEQPH